MKVMVSKLSGITSFPGMTSVDSFFMNIHIIGSSLLDFLLLLQNVPLKYSKDVLTPALPWLLSCVKTNPNNGGNANANAKH